jgi:hypothetical protein
VVASSAAVKISSLEKKLYRLIGGEMMQNKCGISILLTIQVSSEDAVRVFLPKRFIPVFSDVDKQIIYNGMITIGLIYNGPCEKTGAFQLSLKHRL